MRNLILLVIGFLSLTSLDEGVANPWKESRPRLFVDERRIERFRRQIEEEPPLREGWQRLLSRADRLLRTEFVSEDYAETGTGQHGNYGRPSSQVSDMGQTLGLVYLMTGQQRYAEKLRDALLHHGGYRRWGGADFARRDPPWHSELNTARFCYGYAVGYDWIHGFLSPNERKRIAAAVVRLGILPTLNDWILPEKRIHALDSMGHNWWSVCVAEAGLAALSLLGDEPRAEAWVEDVARAFPLWFSYRGNVLQNKSTNFDEGGAFYESVGYANYALSEYLLFRLAYSNAVPDSRLPEVPLLEQVGHFFLHTCYPTSSSLLTVNFGDQSLRGHGAATVRLLLANGHDDGRLQWYLERTDPGLSSPVGLLYHDANRKASHPRELTKSVIYPDIGWAILRSSWEDDATMLAVKSGFTWNHAHADAGSFILFHGGKPLIIDSGTCSYGRREYVGYYCQSRAHNVVLFDGEGQSREDIPRGVKTTGRVHRLLDAAGLKYVYADATGPTSRHFLRNYRHFLWLEDVILIFDDLRMHEPGMLQWLLHYEGKIEKQHSCLRLSNGDAGAIVRPIFPESVVVAEQEGLADHRPDVKVSFLSLSPPERMREAKFVTAIMPFEAGRKASLPCLERLEGPGMIGVRISGEESVTDVYINLRADGRRMHRNSNNVIAGWETDAYLLAITRPGGNDPDGVDSTTRYFVACGSYLRKNAKVVLDSVSKVYAVLSMGDRDIEVSVQGQPSIEASIRCAVKPQRLFVNGKQTDLEYNKATESLRISIQGK